MDFLLKRGMLDGLLYFVYFEQKDQPMSRLYYESDVRIRKWRDLAPMPKQYLEKLLKIIPSEVILGFTTVVGFIKLTSGTERIILKCVAFCVFMTIIPFYYIAISKGRPCRNHCIVSMLSFVVWGYYVSGEFMVGAAWYDSVVASVSLLLFTTLSSYAPLNR
jgi:hypothetical protein